MRFWPLTNSDFPTDQTFHQFHDLYTELDLHRIMLWVVSMEHMQRVWLASRERLPFRTPGSVPHLGLANAPIVETKFLELAMSLHDFSPRIPLGTFSILLRSINAYIAHWRQWSGVLLYLYQDHFTKNCLNLPSLYSTFHLEFPLVLSRFCLEWKIIWCKQRTKITFLYLSKSI